MDYSIINVLTSKELTDKLIIYARQCSFQGTGSYLADLLTDNAFEDYEKVFAVIADGEIIGFGALLKECLCLDSEMHSPWLDFLFVDEKYRNNHIGYALISKICRCAESVGFEWIYLCTASHADYYSKSGFELIYSTNNYNNGVNEIPLCIMRKEI